MKKNSNLEFRKIASLKFLYEINENGTIIRNVKSKKQLKIKLDFHHSEYGYYATFVHLGGRKNSIYKRVMIHSAVAECWLGKKPEGYEIDHIDRNAHNNYYKNLRYVISETRKNGLKPLKLVHETTKEEKHFNSFAECARELSKEYNKSFDAIRDKLKKRRSHIYNYDVIYLNAETGHSDFTE